MNDLINSRRAVLMAGAGQLRFPVLGGGEVPEIDVLNAQNELKRLEQENGASVQSVTGQLALALG